MGHGGREAGGVRLGMCSVGRGDVFSFGGDVFSFSANVFSFGPNVFSFWPNVFTSEGHVFSFRRRASPSRPPLAGSEQALQGRRDDGGSGREAGGAHPGMCQLCRANVSRFWLDVSSFRANVSSFWPNVFSFEGDVSTLAGEVSSFWRCALVGDGARSEGEIPRLRCAALGMTTAAGEVRSGCVRGRGVVRQAHQGRWVRWD